MRIPSAMHAAVLTGHGGLDRLEYRTDVPVPAPGPGEVLINVRAAGMNNTDINTRIGWYSQTVRSGTTDQGGREGISVSKDGMGDWSGDLSFPRIQGADIVGRIVVTGDGTDPSRAGERVICNPYIWDPASEAGFDDARFIGAELDGGFAQFTAVPGSHAVPVPPGTDLPDEALATLPCSGGTAMNMALLANVRKGDRVLVTGASGGVGSFLVQIAKALGAEVTAEVAAAKSDAVLALGADAAVDRGTDDLPKAALAAGRGGPYTVVADVVGGERFAQRLSLLARDGRYVVSGAIAGPLVELDLRTLYLRNLHFHGSTVFIAEAFPALMGLVAKGAIRPAVASVRPLSEIREAQQAFLDKRHVGSMVLVPPAVRDE